TTNVNLLTGDGTDVVNVKRTSSNFSVNGLNGLDTVNVGVAGSVQNINDILRIENSYGYTALNVDDSADTVARNVSMTQFGDIGFITGLAPPSATILYQGSQLRSLVVSGGSGGNTFTIPGTNLTKFPGGGLTTVHTGNGVDLVTVGNSLDGIKSPL